MRARLWICTLSVAVLSGAVSTALADENLSEIVGCNVCHKADRMGSGPSFLDIADRYRGNDTALEQLIEIVKHGGKGQWTAVTNGALMPPYSPRMSDEDIKSLVDWILSQ